MKHKFWAAITAAMLVTSCASPYGKNTLFGGYSDTRIDDSHYLVRFDGNGNSSKDRVWNFWIYRCAELTKEKGYAYFALERSPGKTSSARQIEDQILALREGGDEARLMPTKGASYVPIYIPGGTITTWHTNAVVSMMGDPLPENTVAFRAQAIIDQLDAYIKSDGKVAPPSRDEIFRNAVVLRKATPATGFSGTL
jgi:hypothetical protein